MEIPWDSVLPVLAGLLGAAGGFWASAYTTRKSNEAEKARQEMLFQHQVMIEDRRTLMDFYQQIEQRYQQMVILDDKEEHYSGGGVSEIFNANTGELQPKPRSDDSLERVLLEADVLAPQKYREVLGAWVEAIYSRFWDRSPEDDVSNARRDALDELRNVIGVEENRQRLEIE